MRHLTAQLYWPPGLAVGVDTRCMSHTEQVKQLSSEVSWGNSTQSPQQ